MQRRRRRNVDKRRKTVLKVQMLGRRKTERTSGMILARMALEKRRRRKEELTKTRMWGQGV